MKNNITSLFLLLMAMASGHSNASSIAFNKMVFEQLKQDNHGQQWLLILWSVDCPACIKELKLIEKLDEEYDKLPVILINTDDSGEVIPLRKKIISDHRLSKFENYHFAEDTAAGNRYLIDPTWHGELPRSYFVNEQGVFHGKSGLLKEKTLSKWLINVNH